MLVRHSVDQNTNDWLILRAGKVTGSSVSKVMANYGWIGGAHTKKEIDECKKLGLDLIDKSTTMKVFGEPAKVYAATIAVERLTGNPVESTFYNDHMARGHEQEPIARMLYEQQTFNDVEDGAFWTNGNYGCSPDGLVSDNGITEFKCVTPGAHYASMMNGFDRSYKWQVFYNTWMTEREWCDYGSYCADFPKATRLHVHRVFIDDHYKDVRKVESRLLQFEDLVGETLEAIKRAA